MIYSESDQESQPSIVIEKNEELSFKNVFDRLYSDAKKRFEYADPYNLIKTEASKPEMLFNGNDDEIKLSLSDSNEETQPPPKSLKSKIERVFEDIVREQLINYSGKPEINQRSRKLADKMLKQFYKERKEQEIIEGERVSSPPPGMVNNIQQKEKKRKNSEIPTFHLNLEPKDKEKTSDRSKQSVRQNSIRSMKSMEFNPSKSGGKKGKKQSTDQQQQKEIVYDLPQTVASTNVKYRLKRDKNEDIVVKKNKLEQKVMEKNPQAPKPVKEKQNKYEKGKTTEDLTLQQCTFKPKLTKLRKNSHGDIQTQQQPAKKGYSKKSQSVSDFQIATPFNPKGVNTGVEVNPRPAFNPKTYFDPQRLIGSIETPSFKKSKSLRVPPPNGLLYPDNFKKRKTLARVFVKSRRQKPTYYESLTPSYKPVGFRSGCNIDRIKPMVKPVSTFVDDEFIPGIKVAKPPEIHHSPQHHPRKSAH